MPRIQTLGSENKRTWFVYEGNVDHGTTLIQSGKPIVTHEFYAAALKHFAGRTIRGGFSETKPTPGGFGEWIQENSRKYGHTLTPRHGSFIAAILVHERYIHSSLQGNAILLNFP